MAFDLAVEHAKVRVQFGRPICEFQGIQWKFAEMKMKLDAARLLIYRAVVNADEGRLSPVETAVAKAFTNEAAFWVANEALQIMGGYGYSTEFPIEYVLRRVRGWTIGGENDRDDEKPDRRRDLRQTFQPETPKTFMRSFLNTCTRRAEQ